MQKMARLASLVVAESQKADMLLSVYLSPNICESNLVARHGGDQRSLSQPSKLGYGYERITLKGPPPHLEADSFSCGLPVNRRSSSHSRTQLTAKYGTCIFTSRAEKDL